MKFDITLARDEDGMFVAECPAIPGCVSQGRTADDAMRNVGTPSGNASPSGVSRGFR